MTTWTCDLMNGRTMTADISVPYCFIHVVPLVDQRPGGGWECAQAPPSLKDRFLSEQFTFEQTTKNTTSCNYYMPANEIVLLCKHWTQASKTEPYCTNISALNNHQTLFLVRGWGLGMKLWNDFTQNSTVLIKYPSSLSTLSSVPFSRLV